MSTRKNFVLMSINCRQDQNATGGFKASVITWNENFVNIYFKEIAINITKTIYKPCKHIKIVVNMEIFHNP